MDHTWQLEPAIDVHGFLIVCTGSGHVYFEDCQVGRPARWASDPDKAERLWRLSEELVAKSSSATESKL